MSEQPQFSVDRSVIDFGCLHPGAGAKAIIKVTGGPARVATNHERIHIALSEVGEEATEIEVAISGGSEGELIWDTLHIKGNEGEIDVTIVCWWDESLSQFLKEHILEADNKNAEQPPGPEAQKDTGLDSDASGEREPELAGVSAVAESAPPGVSERTYVGQSCRYCGRNLHYDCDKRMWLECDRCRGWRKLISVPQAVILDTATGIKTEGKKVFKDFWDVLIGKQDWNLR